MPLPGLEPINLVSEEYWYRTITYSAISEYGNDLHCSQYQTFTAERGSHTPRKINECYFTF